MACLKFCHLLAVLVCWIVFEHLGTLGVMGKRPPPAAKHRKPSLLPPALLSLPRPPPPAPTTFPPCVPPTDRRGTVRLGFRLTLNLDFTALEAQGLDREFILDSRQALATVFRVPCAGM